MASTQVISFSGLEFLNSYYMIIFCVIEIIVKFSFHKAYPLFTNTRTNFHCIELIEYLYNKNRFEIKSFINLKLILLVFDEEIH